MWIFGFTSFNTASGKHYCNKQRPNASLSKSLPPVSIPQAVSTIAIIGAGFGRSFDIESFNTASGKHYCNKKSEIDKIREDIEVSIPQAVSTIAIPSI